MSGRITGAQVWTGREVLIWGGSVGTFNNYLADGAAYVPATDSWRRMTGWSGRIVGAAEWTGREMVVWGGTLPTGTPGRTVEIKSADDGRRYVP